MDSKRLSYILVLDEYKLYTLREQCDFLWTDSRWGQKKTSQRGTNKVISM